LQSATFFDRYDGPDERHGFSALFTPAESESASLPKLSENAAENTEISPKPDESSEKN